MLTTTDRAAKPVMHESEAGRKQKQAITLKIAAFFGRLVVCRLMYFSSLSRPSSSISGRCYSGSVKISWSPTAVQEKVEATGG